VALAYRPRPVAKAKEDDAVLVARVVGGDEAAFVALYRRHAEHVARLVYRLLGNDAELDDIVQETFVLGLGALGALDDPGRLRSWLTTVAVRRVKRRLSQRYRRRDVEEAWSRVAPRVSDPADREPVHALYRELARLPAKLRIPWVLHHVEGETLPDVAAYCETSLTSVKRRIAEAERRLERRLHAD
jgi:RNA polymerase sigma-70 factor (ECF subfamily)